FQNPNTMRDRTETLDVPLRSRNPYEPSSSGYSRQISSDMPRGVERLRLQIVDFDEEIDRLKAKQLVSTRGMVCDIEQATDSGIRAVASLEDQDAALDRIEKGLEQIESDVGVMKKNLRRMRSCCGLGHYYFKYIRSPILRMLMGRRHAKSRSESTMGGPLVITLSQREKPTVVRRESQRAQSVRGPTDSLTAEDLEIERNLERVDDGVRTLKEVAFDIHTQLEIQRPKIDRLNKLVEENDISIGGANRTVKKLLNE
ncbi:aex-4, partial [Pristionchus pacificus]|uniref:Aex-4 n=1 Tax=Pristionchus pacificus TaxID=54126 RepID=A0A2A6C839_PRIPA